IEVTMPRLSDTMEVGTVVKWNVKPGQKVKTGDVLADIETDKAMMELQSFDDGTVAKLAIPEGQSVKVGQVILVLAAVGEGVEAAPAGGPPAAPVAKKAEGTSQPQRPAPSIPPPAIAEPPRSASSAPSNGPASLAEPRGRVFASPLAKKIAEESGIDLARVEGTGP